MLRTAAHSGMRRTSRPCWSSDSILSMAGRPETEQRDERPAGLVRPRVARRGHAVGQAVQRALGDGPVQLGRGGGQAQRQRGVVGDRRQRGQGDLAVDLDHVGAEVGGSRRGAGVRGATPEAPPAAAGSGPRGGAGARRRR